MLPDSYNFGIVVRVGSTADDARDAAAGQRHQVPRQEASVGTGYRLVTEVDPDRPAPTYLDVGHRAVEWVAEQTGGIPQSSVFDAVGNMPMTAHVLGGALMADALSQIPVRAGD